MESAAMMKLQVSICQQKLRLLPWQHGWGRRSGSGAAVLVRCSAGQLGKNGSPRQLRVAYEGVAGAFSETAARKAFPAGCHAIIPCDSLESAFQDSLVGKIADRAVVPVENHDLLLRRTLHGRLHIVGEGLLPVRHCLLALPGVRRERLTRVISHPLALAQCEQTLTDMMGLAVRRQRFSNTAGAAAYVAANGLRDTAAVASSRAAELYGMEVLADGIQDDDAGDGNVTRFVVLARELVVPPRSTDDGRRPIKTSIVFAGASFSVLFKVLAAFAKRDISLTRIETRPKYHNIVETRLLGRMFWYVDFQASLADPRAQNAMAEVHEFTSFLQVLGSYPMAMDDM